MYKVQKQNRVYFYVVTILPGIKPYALKKAFAIKWGHICKENTFVGWATNWLIMLKPYNMPNPVYQCQTAYCAIDSSLVLFVGLDDLYL